MLLFERAAEPEGFEDEVRDSREAVEASVREGKKPIFEDVWRRYKGNLAAARHGKCAYCEVVMAVIGDIDHFRPKGSLSELHEDPSTWGREREPLANVEGRRLRQVSPLGYWWLAYEWSNLLFACERCNRTWKRDLFPVAERPRTLPPERDGSETPLLLDPCGSDEPSRHLRFSDWGQVEAHEKSRIGLETIRTLGLDRETLQRSRAEKAKRVHRLVWELSSKGGRFVENLCDILEMGNAKNPHAGMVRIVFEQEIGPWTELESALAPKSDQDPPTA